MLSCIFGKNREIYFPKLSKEKNLLSFSDLAIKYLKSKGYEAYICETEDEARALVKTLPDNKKWPCLFTSSNTTGEKDIEEFFKKNEKLDMNKYINLGIIKNNLENYNKELDDFESAITKFKSNMIWDKESIIEEFKKLIPEFNYIDKKKYLDGKM